MERVCRTVWKWELRWPVNHATTSCSSRSSSAQDAAEPLLAGAALQRRRLGRARHAGRVSRHEGRGRLGRGLHRGVHDRRPMAMSCRGSRSQLWDDGDVRNLACDVRQHPRARLAGRRRAVPLPAPLAHNAETRPPARGVSQIPSEIISMASGRALDQARDQAAAPRARRRVQAGASGGLRPADPLRGHGDLPDLLPLPGFNKRTDEYGGSFENRIRFTREVLRGPPRGDRRLRDRDAVLDRHPRRSVWLRRCRRPSGRRGWEFIAALDHLVDYWDLNIGTSTGARTPGRRGSSRPTIRPSTPARKEVSTKPVRQRRPLHRPRRDGRGHQLRPVRHHRRRSAVDRRSVPAEEDRGGPARRHPRVHRLQRLRVALGVGARPDLVHPERDQRRGVPPRLASGEFTRRPTPRTTC